MTRSGDTATNDAVQLASKTDVGQVRDANEDSCDDFARDDGTRLLVVADGMGGHRGGATASRTAVATIAETFERESRARADEMLVAAIQGANARIHEMAQQDTALGGMGTTVVVFHMDAHRRGTVAHVGDSRAYRCRQAQLEPLTIDHSVVAEMQRRGLLSSDEAARHPRRNEILRSVGVLPEVDVEVTDVEIRPGDRFLLCSDGLSAVVDDDEIAAVVHGEAPDRAVESLVRLANERGGPDNVTVQILSIPADESADDPEATAAIEISAAGIETIQAQRRQHSRTRRIATAALLLVLAGSAYGLWSRLSKPITDSPPAASEETADPALAVPRESSPDRFEIEQEPPRRGIPRDLGTP